MSPLEPASVNFTGGWNMVLTQTLSDIANVLLCRPKRDVHDESPPLRNHPRRGKLTRVVVRTSARAAHRVPTPEWLFPEWLGPCEIAILDHALIATPDVIHQDVDPMPLSHDAVNHCLNLIIIGVIALNRDAAKSKLGTRDSTPRDIYSCP